MAKKKKIEEKTEKPVSKPKAKKSGALIQTADIIKGSFVIADNKLKLTVIDAAGSKMNTVLPLDRTAVDLILS